MKFFLSKAEKQARAAQRAHDDAQAAQAMADTIMADLDAHYDAAMALPPVARFEALHALRADADALNTRIIDYALAVIPTLAEQQEKASSRTAVERRTWGGIGIMMPSTAFVVVAASSGMAPVAVLAFAIAGMMGSIALIQSAVDTQNKRLDLRAALPAHAADRLAACGLTERLSAFYARIDQAIDATVRHEFTAFQQSPDIRRLCDNFPALRHAMLDAAIGTGAKTTHAIPVNRK